MFDMFVEKSKLECVARWFCSLVPTLWERPRLYYSLGIIKNTKIEGLTLEDSVSETRRLRMDP